jgi:carbonyl reductase 1
MMASSARIALVTGANQGIGYGLVQALAHSRKFDTILLGSRDLSKGEEAASLLRSKESFENIQPIQLDVTDENSIKEAFKTISQKFGHLNLLINNAGIAFKGSRFDEEVCRVSADTNYQGTVNVSETLLPLLTAATSARIVSISSLAGRSALKGMSEANRARFLDPNLTKPQLDALLEEFILSVRSGTYKGTETFFFCSLLLFHPRN